jgi:thiol-disulfide isomerase/thioredoxin
MLERVLLSIALVLAGTVGWMAFNRLSVRRAARMAARYAGDPALHSLQAGIPAVLYFTTPSCVPCRTLQRPALEQLRTALGSDQIQVLEVDATEQPELADRWGVFSAPTTFILDQSLTPRVVNRGVASFETLKSQVGALTPGPSPNGEGRPDRLASPSPLGRGI